MDPLFSPEPDFSFLSPDHQVQIATQMFDCTFSGHIPESIHQPNCPNAPVRYPARLANIVRQPTCHNLPVSPDNQTQTSAQIPTLLFGAQRPDLLFNPDAQIYTSAQKPKSSVQPGEPKPPFSPDPQIHSSTHISTVHCAGCISRYVFPFVCSYTPRHLHAEIRD